MTGPTRTGSSDHLLEKESATGLANTVMYTIATEGYLPFVLNLHASLSRLDLGDALIVYALDDGAHATLSELGVHSIRYAVGPIAQKSLWGTAPFARTMAFKYDVALDILKTGQHAFYVDSDIVFLRNPFDYLRQVLAESPAELVMQVQAPNFGYNAGFWVARATPAVAELFGHLGEECRGAGDDQTLLNQWLPASRSVRVFPLDAELFACGNQFLEGVPVEQGGYCIDRSVRRFPFESAYILHFNFLIGDKAKVRAMAQYGAIFHPQLVATTGGRLFRAKLLLRRLWTGR